MNKIRKAKLCKFAELTRPHSDQDANLHLDADAVSNRNQANLPGFSDQPSANLPKVGNRKDGNSHLSKTRNCANLRNSENPLLRKLSESEIFKLLFAVSVSSAARKEHPTPGARGSLTRDAGDETATRRQSNSFNLYPGRDNAFAELSALKEGHHDQSKS